MDRIIQAQFEVGGKASRDLDDTFVTKLADQMWKDGIFFQSPLELLVEADPDDSRTTDASKWNETLIDELKNMRFIVFAHQHQCAAMQKCMDRWNHVDPSDSRLNFQSLKYVKAHVWTGLSDEQVLRLGQIHNDVEHNIKLRGPWTTVMQLRHLWQSKDSYFPGIQATVLFLAL